MTHTRVYTIGHSRHERGVFLELCGRHGVRAVVDVRSRPYSRRAPQFSKSELERWLAEAAIEYRFMGRELGGLLDGGVTYERRAREPDFVAALEHLVELAAARPTAILCAEEDPARCHRRLMIAPALAARAEVVHIRGDGRCEREPGQLSLL